MFVVIPQKHPMKLEKVVVCLVCLLHMPSKIRCIIPKTVQNRSAKSIDDKSAKIALSSRVLPVCV